jgi:hypothetical protein
MELYFMYSKIVHIYLKQEIFAKDLCPHGAKLIRAISSLHDMTLNYDL